MDGWRGDEGGTGRRQGRGDIAEERGKDRESEGMTKEMAGSV